MNITEILVFWTAGRDAIPGVCAACPEVDAADCSYAAGRPHEAVVIAVVRDGVRALQIRDVLKARGMDAVLVEKVAPLRALQTLFARKPARRTSSSVAGNSPAVTPRTATTEAGTPTSSRYQRLHGGSPDERSRVDARLRRLRALRVAVVALGSLAIVFFVGLSVLLVIARGESVDNRGSSHLRADDVSPSDPGHHAPQATEEVTGADRPDPSDPSREHARREGGRSDEPGAWSLADSPLSFLIPSPASGSGLAGALAVLVLFPWLSRTRSPWLRRIAGWVVPTVGCGVAFALLVMIVAMLDASRAEPPTETAHAGMEPPTQPGSSSPGALDAVATAEGAGTSPGAATDSLRVASEAEPDFTRISAASFVARIREASDTPAGASDGSDPRHAPVPRGAARSPGGPCADFPIHSASSLLCQLRAASLSSEPAVIDDEHDAVAGAHDDEANEYRTAAEPYEAPPNDARPTSEDPASAQRGDPEPAEADRGSADSAEPRRGHAAPAALEPNDTAPHDTAPHDTAPNDTAPHDTAPHDTAPHDTAPNDTARDVAASGPPAVSSFRPDRAEADSDEAMVDEAAASEGDMSGPTATESLRNAASGGTEPGGPRAPSDGTPRANATALAPAPPNGSSPWRHPGWHFAGMFLFAATTIGAGRRLATRMEYHADGAVLPSSVPATESLDDPDGDASEEPT